MEDGIVYLALTDKAYPKRLAFGYLIDVQREFASELRRDHGEQWPTHINTLGRAYAYLKFGACGGRAGRRRRWAPVGAAS